MAQSGKSGDGRRKPARAARGKTGAGISGAARTAARAPGGDPAERILETALEIAEQRGWRAVRLVDVAERLGMAPTEVLRHYRDKDAVANAWFRRGLEAMLAPKPRGFAAQPPPERIEYCILAWFDALAPHRRVTAEMLRVKANPSHLHTWAPMVFDLSRLIHWLREAAALPATYGTRRADTEEIGLTWLFAATLWVWCGDETEGQDRTRRFLRRRLDQADRALARLFRRAEAEA